MPTPGGLYKAGDIIINDGIMYVVVERTSSSAPYSVWIQRQDGKQLPRALAIRSNSLRVRGRVTQFRLPLETGELPGDWIFWDPEHNRAQALARDLPGNLGALLDRDNPADVAKVEAEAERQGTYMPARTIRVQDAHRYKDPTDARYYGHEAEVILRDAFGTAQAIVMSDKEAMDLAIRLLQYLRDKDEGITS